MTRKGLLQPLMLAALLAVGFAAVWGVLSAYILEVGAATAMGEADRWNLVFRADGTPLVTRQVGWHGSKQYHDLAGNPVPEPDHERGDFLHLTPLPETLPARSGAADWEHRIRAVADGRTPAVYWYFLSDGRQDGAGYFVGYDSHSRARIGYLGTAGLREEMPPPEELFPFGGVTSGPEACIFCTQTGHSVGHPDGPPVGGRAPRGSASTWDVYLLAPGGKVYHADLQQRAVEVVVDEPRLRSAALVAEPPDRVRGTPFRLAVRTDDDIRILDEHGRQRKRYPVPEALRGRNLSFAEASTGEAVLYWHSPVDAAAPETEHRIFWVSEDGRHREVRTALPSPAQPWAEPLTGLVLPSPLGLGVVLTCVRPGTLQQGGLAATYEEALARAFREYGPALLSAQLLAAALAVLCQRRLVRFGASRGERVLWPLFVLVLGVPGWVGWRFSRSWPVLEPCPACAARIKPESLDLARRPWIMRG